MGNKTLNCGTARHNTCGNVSESNSQTVPNECWQTVLVAYPNVLHGQGQCKGPSMLSSLSILAWKERRLEAKRSWMKRKQGRMEGRRQCSTEQQKHPMPESCCQQSKDGAFVHLHHKHGHTKKERCSRRSHLSTEWRGASLQQLLPCRLSSRTEPTQSAQQKVEETRRFEPIVSYSPEYDLAELVRETPSWKQQA